jgi:hypothetical protein
MPTRPGLHCYQLRDEADPLRLPEGRQATSEAARSPPVLGPVLLRHAARPAEAGGDSGLGRTAGAIRRLVLQQLGDLERRRPCPHPLQGRTELALVVSMLRREAIILHEEEVCQ